MSERVKIILLASEVIKILESLAFDNFEKNKILMGKLITQLNIPIDYAEKVMDRLEYFTNELIRLEKGFEG